jgi:hypothetical protein
MKKMTSLRKIHYHTVMVMTIERVIKQARIKHRMDQMGLPQAMTRCQPLANSPSDNVPKSMGNQSPSFNHYL